MFLVAEGGLEPPTSGLWGNRKLSHPSRQSRPVAKTYNSNHYMQLFWPENWGHLKTYAYPYASDKHHFRRKKPEESAGTILGGKRYIERKVAKNPDWAASIQVPPRLFAACFGGTHLLCIVQASSAICKIIIFCKRKRSLSRNWGNYMIKARICDRNP